MPSKRVLGRGLGAFFPEYEEEGSGKTADDHSSDHVTKPEKRVNIILQIPVENIRPNPNQPRKEFNPDRLEELSDSIKKHGLIQPITVRYIGEKRFELISGERRLRAVKLAGMDEIPSYIREVDDENTISYALIENIQREDLNPMEIAMGYQRLVDELNHTQVEVARKVGKDRSTVANMLRLLHLPPFIQAALRDEKLTVGHARALINIDDEETQKKIFEKAISNDYSVRQIEQAVRTHAKKKEKNREKKEFENAAFYNEISNRLRRKLSTKVNIKPKKDGGEIRIEYYSDEELERLLEIFESL